MNIKNIKNVISPLSTGGVYHLSTRWEIIVDELHHLLSSTNDHSVSLSSTSLGIKRNKNISSKLRLRNDLSRKVMWFSDVTKLIGRAPLMPHVHIATWQHQSGNRHATRVTMSRRTSTRCFSYSQWSYFFTPLLRGDRNFL